LGAAKLKSFLSDMKNSQAKVIGPELIFDKIYDSIGFNDMENELFRHLVITRLFHSGSKLEAIDYLQRFLGTYRNIGEIYRFLDTLNSQLKEQAEQIAFDHTKSVLGGEIRIVFHDFTILHFEISDENDLHRIGFSNAGKHKRPQIYLELLVGLHGFTIGYEIFGGNIYVPVN
jgi:hypothetical protein